MDPILSVVALSVVLGAVIVFVFFKSYFLKQRSEVQTIAKPELHSDPKKPSKPPQPIFRKSHAKHHSHASGKDQNKRHHPLDLNTLKGHADSVAGLCFSSDGRNLATGVWQSDEGASSTVDAPRDNLASLYRPPFHLMFQGPFRNAKAAASLEDKWLVVNLQSMKEFSSHMLNRDTWGNETVSQAIKTNFIFWQAYDDASEGRKVCTYYKLDSIPVVLVIDPITGEKMRSRCGMVEPESLLEDLLRFMDGGPRDYHATLSLKRPRGSSVTPQQKVKMSTDETMEDEEMLRAVAASLENVKDKEEPCSTKKPTYPPLPEEPKGDRSLLCRVGVRLPGGRRVQRNFRRTDSIQLLWSFCYAQLGEAESKPFRLTQPIPGASKSLDYDSKLTFEESGLANSMISVAWE
ncbi:UBX domain - like 2 [Theobroma cacao]|nr:UBX domain - like 2 [Theobroma cacao]